jgi:hypothetical protein
MLRPGSEIPFPLEIVSLFEISDELEESKENREILLEAAI